MLSQSVTEKVVEFVTLGPRCLVAEVTDAAVRSIVDSVGVILAGRATEVFRVLTTSSVVPQTLDGDERRVIGGGIKTSSDVAAIVNGIAGHALDFDDTLAGHPSSPLLAALVAVAPRRTSGENFIDAFVTGHEVTVKVAQALNPEHYRIGWHTTSVCSTIGVTAAVARLMRLDASKTRAALGIAASLAAGLQRNFGTMTKPLHSGLAARNGVFAAQLAANGLSADGEIFDGHKGFLEIFSGATARPDPLLHLGDPYALIIPGTSLKMYPCCNEVHRPIDAVLQLQRDHNFAPEEIESLSCDIPVGGMTPLRYPRPATGLQAKFSLPYALAAALVDRKVSLDTFTDDAVARPAISQLLDRISAQEDPRCRPNDPEMNRTASVGRGGFVEVNVRARGAEFVARIEHAIGYPGNPMQWNQIEQKFADCLQYGGWNADIGMAAFEGLRGIAGAGDVHALLEGLADAR